MLICATMEVIWQIHRTAREVRAGNPATLVRANARVNKEEKVMNNNVKKALSPIILKITAPDPDKRISVKELFDAAADGKKLIEFQVTKAVQDADGFMSPIDGVSNEAPVKIEVVLNGAEYRNSRGTVGLFKGYTTEAVTLPGRRSIRVTTLDDNGKESGKDDDDTCLGAMTFVQLAFDEGSQSGEIRRYANSEFDVKLGSMTKTFPIDDPDDTTTPLPMVCRNPVREDDINA